MSKVTASDVRQSNYLTIYRLFFQNEQLSKPQIARLLGLSLPTVNNNIAVLESEGKIREHGTFDSQGGRPAIAYQLVEDAAVAIGVEVQSKRVRCAVVNLNGKITSTESFKLKFDDSIVYIERFCQLVNQFIEVCSYHQEQILGIGISFQGIANKDGQSILYSKILQNPHLDVAALQPCFAYPIRLLHDVKCAASAELFYAPQQIDNAIYLSISEHLGGALIINNQIDQGKQGYSGALEHFQISGAGKPCYCGQIGCLETYCSLSALLNENESLAEFFQQLRAGEPNIQVRWQQFLNALAKALNYVYLLLERNIILGGEIAPYLHENDLAALSQIIRMQSAFPIEGAFISIATLQQNASLLGAGLPFINEYLP